MEIPQEIQELDDTDLIEEFEGGIRHLTICDLEGQADPKEESINSVVRKEILSRMSTDSE